MLPIIDILKFGEFNPYDSKYICPTVDIDDFVGIRTNWKKPIDFGIIVYKNEEIDENAYNYAFAQEYFVKNLSTGKIIQVGPLEIWSHISSKTLLTKFLILKDIYKINRKKIELDMYLITNTLISNKTNQKIIWK